MPDVAVILLSYNRPRMLREALATITGAAEVIVTDDASDFDVEAVVRDSFPAAQFVHGQPASIEARLVTPRLGKLINAALSLVTAPYLTYLCDDDLFDAGWIEAISHFFAAHPQEHWVRGTWYAFEDGQAPGTTPCPLDPRQLTTGNFAHATACYRDEGVRWSETTVACHDDTFLWDVNRFHNTYAVPHCGAVAGWRRLHKHNQLHYAAGAQYAPNGANLFADGFLET